MSPSVIRKKSGVGDGEVGVRAGDRDAGAVVHNNCLVRRSVGNGQSAQTDDRSRAGNGDAGA